LQVPGRAKCCPPKPLSTAESVGSWTAPATKTSMQLCAKNVDWDSSTCLWNHLFGLRESCHFYGTKCSGGLLEFSRNGIWGIYICIYGHPTSIHNYSYWVFSLLIGGWPWNLQQWIEWVSCPKAPWSPLPKLKTFAVPFPLYRCWLGSSASPPLCLKTRNARQN
jgi:hypothetical protein